MVVATRIAAASALTACLVLGVQARASAQDAADIVGFIRLAQKTNKQFTKWCEGEAKRYARTGKTFLKILPSKSPRTVTVTCHWFPDFDKDRERSFMVTHKAKSGVGDRILVDYPPELYSKVDGKLKAKYGAKNGTFGPMSGKMYKGWDVDLMGRDGSVIHWMKSDNGMLIAGYK
jgi:hypothetical protein